MPSFFIDRPIFAWVVALFICLIGAISIPLLAVAQYPIIAPPSISISTSYPGASPENLYNSVTRLIEEELNGASGILNFESTSDSLGQVEIIANFVPGTETSAASVEVQNRLKRVEARLPRAVIQQGILVEEASSAVLQIITLRSTDGSLDEVGLGDFMIRNILGEVRRIPGVGRATLYSTERSLRIWIDPAKLVGYRPDRRRRQQGDRRAERAGRLGQHRRRAEHAGHEDCGAGAGEGPAVLAGRIRRHHPARQRRRLDRAAARRRPHRDRRPQLSVPDPPQRQADRGPLGAAVADRQCAGDRERGRKQDEGAVEVLSGQYRLRHSLQHHARGEGLDPQGADDAGRGGGAGVHRDVPVPAEHPLHHDPDHRGAGGAARGLRRADADGLLHQHAHHVRHGAGGRHSRRRRHRRGRERRAHHGRGRPAAEGSDAQGDVADHRRHHRHHAGAGRGVPADGVLPGIGRHHLPPVLRHHGGGDLVLRAAGAVADACAVRDAAETRRGRPRPREEGRVRLVQPRCSIPAAIIIRARCRAR